MQQLGTCVVFKRFGCYPAARCLQCAWEWAGVHDEEQVRVVAEHSRWHTNGGLNTTTVTEGTMRVTLNGVLISGKAG